MKLFTLLAVAFLLSGSVLLACPPETTAKITFDLAQISSDGLIGPPDGRRSLDYEFCIPTGEAYQLQVQTIDPSLKFYPGGRGRVGCTTQQTLCIGNTHQAKWRAILLEIARLPYVQRIDQTVWE
ncbi:MAG: hypothetical protein ACKO24_07245 [Leptolyngbyaceae cyanobacterium]